MHHKLWYLLHIRCFALFIVFSLGWTPNTRGQGTIAFNNHIGQRVVTHIYLGSDHQIAGNGPADYPPGTQDWTAFTPLSGTGYTAQLWAANGPDQPESSLQALFPTTTFVSVPLGAGSLVNAGNMNVPGIPEGATATLTLRVWDNQGGTLTSWAMAQTAGAAAGESPLFNSLPLGTPTGSGADLVGLVSFNIYQVPEPSVLAFACVAAAALWLFGHGGARIPLASGWHKRRC